MSAHPLWGKWICKCVLLSPQCLGQSLGTHDHLSSICWMSPFLYLCITVRCVSIGNEFLGSKVCTDCPEMSWQLVFPLRLPEHVFFSWHPGQRDAPVTLSFLFLELSLFIPSLVHLPWLLPPPRILSGHTVTWCNFSFYSGLTLPGSSLERPSLTFSYEVTSQSLLSRHILLFSS